MHSQDLLMQNGTFNQCSGIFYDSGGPSGDYGDNESITLTICPDTPGQAAQLNFTSFITEPNTDFLTIYDGTDILAPVFWGLFRKF